LGDAIEGLLSEIIGGTAKGNENMTTWCDQVALVTGGARGIGRATARLLAQRGAAVCVNYAAHADAAEGLAAEIMAAGGRAIAAMAVIGGMRARRYGRIVNISSVAAIGTALPGNAFYAASKAEVAILTKRFAMELGPHNITVNAVAPGFIRSKASLQRL